MDKVYRLRYLPLFEKDLAAARDYITLTLQNPTAALRLVDETGTAILKRLGNPVGFSPYHSVRDRDHPYYRITVKNYMVFYVVIDDVMEVRRFVYSRRNLTDIV